MHINQQPFKTYNSNSSPKDNKQYKKSRSRQPTNFKPFVPSLRVQTEINSEMLTPKDIVPMSLLIQSRPSTCSKNFDFGGREKLRKNQTQVNLLPKREPSAQNSHRTISHKRTNSKPHSTNKLGGESKQRDMRIMKPSYNTVNMNFQFNQITPSIGHGKTDPTVSSQIAKRLDIEVDSNSDLKTLKHQLATLITQYKRAVKDYIGKLSEVKKFVNRMAYEENLRTIPDMQELFKFCRDKLEISEEVILTQSEIFEKRKDLQLQNIELSNVKNKLQKSQSMLKKVEQENKDLKKQVLRGIEDCTSLYKSNVQQQTNSKNMKKKVEELEQGLKTICGSDLHGDSLQMQSRLKTTIHLLVQENNSLKKELSLMQNQGDEQREEIDRLKKKINHLVIKIDAQRKEKDTITRRLTNKYISDMNMLQIGTPSPEKVGRQSLAFPVSFQSFNNKVDMVHEEFELIDRKSEIHQAKLELNKILHSDRSNYVTKSNFNLQGPYWKNRTNKILKQERIYRDAFNDENKLENSIFQFPHIRKSDNRQKRTDENFKLSFLNSEQSKTLRELQELGTNNFVETIMSLRALEVKKNLETITREYQQRNNLFSLQTFLLGQTYDYFFSNHQSTKQLIKNINTYTQKHLKLKEAKVWFRDILNNYIWTVNQNNQIEGVDLTQNDEISNLFSNILFEPQNVGSTLENDLCLYVPIVDYTSEYCLGFVQISVSINNIREDGFDFGFEQQLGAQLISEYMSLILDKEFKEKASQYIVRKRQDSLQACLSILDKSGVFEIYSYLEQSLIKILDIDRIKILIKLNNKIHTITNEEKLEFAENTDSIMGFSLNLPKSIIVFMPYSHPTYNVKIDMDTQMPINVIQLKSIDGEVFGAIEFENKMVKNRSDPNKQIVAFQDQGVIQVVQEIGNFVYLALQK